MKKIIFTAVLALGFSLALQATDDTVITPEADYSFRTNGTVSATQEDDPTGWQSGFPKTNATIECAYSAKMWGMQRYDVTSIDWNTVTSVSLTLYKADDKSYRLGVWMYPNADWTESESQTWSGDPKTCPIVENFKSIVGAYPGHQTANKTYVAFSDGDISSKYVINFTGSTLTTLKSAVVTKGEKKYINLIITFKDTDASYGDRKPKYHSTTENKTPFLTITTDDPAVTNLNTSEGYSDLASAISAASENDLLQVNEDVTVTSRIENNVAITIQGKTGSEKIFRGTGLDDIVFVTKNAALTLKNLIIDGQGTERARAAVEASNYAVTMSNVTIQNFAGTSQRVLQVKKSCTVENCTFKDNTVASGYGDIFVGASNCLTLKGSNTIGNGIYVEKALYFNDGGTTHTIPIKVIAASDRDTNTGLGSNKALIKNTTDTYKYSFSGATSWDIAGNESKNYIYVTKAASTTKSSDKTMAAGAGYKLGTVTIE